MIIAGACLLVMFAYAAGWWSAVLRWGRKARRRRRPLEELARLWR